MKASIVQIVELLNTIETTYLVPFYQRESSWEIQDVENLMDDIKSIGRISSSNAIETVKCYFLGTIVLSHIYTNHETDDKCRLIHEIIDGQQRLLTLSLMAKVIVELIKSDELKTNFKQWYITKSKSDYFKNLPTDFEAPLSERLLYSTYGNERKKYRFVPKLDDKLIFNSILNDNALCDDKQFLTKHYEKIKERISSNPIDYIKGFCLLSICKLELEAGDDPQEIYDSINSKLKPLKEYDKIRNFVLQPKTASSQNRQVCYKYIEDNLAPIWERIENSFKSSIKDKIQNFDSKIPKYWTKFGKEFDSLFKLFFLHYVYVKKKEQVSKNQLYKTFKKDIGSNLGNKSLLDDIGSFSNIFLKIVGLQNENQKPIRNAIYELLRIPKFTAYCPLLMSIYHKIQEINKENKNKWNNTDIENFVKITKSIISHYVRFNLVKGTRNLSKFYPTIFNRLITSDSRQILQSLNYVLFFENSNTVCPKSNEFEGSFKKTKMYEIKKELCRYLLSEISWNCGFSHAQERNIDINKFYSEEYHIEHILPENWKQHWKNDLKAWGQDLEKVDDLKHKIGNLTLLEGKLNLNLSNKSFGDKKQNTTKSETNEIVRYGYRSHPILIISKIGENDKWGYCEVNKRSEFLLNEVNKIWKLPKLNSNDKIQIRSKVFIEKFNSQTNLSSKVFIHKLLVEILSQNYDINIEKLDDTTFQIKIKRTVLISIKIVKDQSNKVNVQFKKININELETDLFKTSRTRLMSKNDESLIIEIDCSKPIIDMHLSFCKKLINKALTV
ncbi:MAG: DUF262 domain-containing HNH endonuclease family protein [Flavobacteriaceae bacterium]|nr:DUF262 domain-containing HNH endonuclease family protein [Flavobacteriaceae bacterium]